jgi:NAD+ synthase
MQKLPRLDLEKTERNIIKLMKQYDSHVLGISGGLDSACVAALAAKAVGPENVLGVLMNDCPDKSLEDAMDVVNTFGIEHKVNCIEPVMNEYKRMLDIKPNQLLDLGNLKARTRMSILYYHANKDNRIVVGTGDKSEILIGYFTKYGDGGVDILPIGNLYKTQVRDLAREIGVPEKIIRKPSSPDLWEGQTAEGELGISYEELDPMLYGLVDVGMCRFSKEYASFDKKKLEYVDRLVRKTRHKREMPTAAEVVYRG